MPHASDGEIDVTAAAAISGRSTETVRRWVWSGRLPAHKHGNKFFIARPDLDRLLRSNGITGGRSLRDWIAAVEKSGLKQHARRESASDLVFADRRSRSWGLDVDASL